MKNKQNKKNQSSASTNFLQNIMTLVNYNERICKILYSQWNFYLKILNLLSKK